MGVHQLAFEVAGQVGHARGPVAAGAGHERVVVRLRDLSRRVAHVDLESRGIERSGGSQLAAKLDPIPEAEAVHFEPRLDERLDGYQARRTRADDAYLPGHWVDAPPHAAGSK
jgi:hypothetical protein